MERGLSSSASVGDTTLGSSGASCLAPTTPVLTGSAWRRNVTARFPSKPRPTSTPTHDGHRLGHLQPFHALALAQRGSLPLRRRTTPPGKLRLWSVQQSWRLFVIRAELTRSFRPCMQQRGLATMRRQSLSCCVPSCSGRRTRTGSGTSRTRTHWRTCCRQARAEDSHGCSI